MPGYCDTVRREIHAHDGSFSPLEAPQAQSIFRTYLGHWGERYAVNTTFSP